MKNNIQDTALKEQRLLKISIIATLLLSLITIIFGFLSHASALAFDGFYSLIDAMMTYVALIIARLIMKGDNDRFQYGMWHLEPLLIFINGSVLAFTCMYAFLNAMTGLVAGGKVVNFEMGAIFEGISSILCLMIYFYLRHGTKKLNSDLLRVDAKAWLVSGVLSSALFISLILGQLLQSSEKYGHLAAYVDPVILAIASLIILPFPLITLWSASKEILEIAPEELSQKVNIIAESVARRHGFIDYEYHVSKTGRQQFIEIGLVASSRDTIKSFGDLDRIREEIAKGMGDLGPGYWLSVDFTADKRWI